MHRPSLTVVAVTGIDREGHQRAIERTLEALPFETPHILCWQEGMTLPDYSHFMVKDLFRLIGTEYALVVQRDGYGVNKELWDDEFLAADYIGAVFPHGEVGNGGLSIRSRLFMESASMMPEPMPGVGEDAWLTQSGFCRDAMESLGVRFAPAAVAARFSFEHEVPGITHGPEYAWGHHGKWHE